jgi:hypothetical protein
MIIPDSNFSIPYPGSRAEKAPDHGYPTKNIGIFNPIICCNALGKNNPECLLLIPVRNLDFFHPGSRIQDSKKHRIRNTAIAVTYIAG